MIDFLRSQTQLLLILIFWVFTAYFLDPLIYAVLPVSVFLMRARGMYAEILMGFIFVLILSDFDPGYVPMRQFKTAKNLYMIATALVFIIDRRRFQPFSQVFYVFVPFLVYSFFPLLWSGAPIVGIQKTISYSLLFLVVPNFVVQGFRERGWTFVNELFVFLFFIVAVSWFVKYIDYSIVLKATRFRGFFGNPNGMGIFLFLFYMLFHVITSLKPDLFSRVFQIIITLSIFFWLYKCGSRTALVASLLYLVFSRIFRVSPFLGLLGFILAVFGMEYVSSNLLQIVMAFNLEDYFRIETLEDGSGRYLAWSFAWEKIQEFLLFGGGFGNDEFIMRQHYEFLNSQGHHGGVHNSYLTMWFNMGIFGLLIYFRSFFLIFLKGAKRIATSYAIMFAVLFAITYESWINGSLNPFTIILLIIVTIVTEDEFVDDAEEELDNDDDDEYDDDEGDEHDEGEKLDIFGNVA